MNIFNGKRNLNRDGEINSSFLRKQKGLTLIEILISLVVAGIGVSAFLQTVKPTIAMNKSNKNYVDLSGALAEILDSAMTQPVAVLDSMNGKVFNSRQGVSVKLRVSNYTSSEADAIMTGLIFLACASYKFLPHPIPYGALVPRYRIIKRVLLESVIPDEFNPKKFFS